MTGLVAFLIGAFFGGLVIVSIVAGIAGMLGGDERGGRARTRAFLGFLVVTGLRAFGSWGDGFDPIFWVGSLIVDAVAAILVWKFLERRADRDDQSNV